MMLFLQSLGVPGTIIPAFDPYDIRRRSGP